MAFHGTGVFHVRRRSYIFLAIGAGVGIALLASCYKAAERKTYTVPETATNPIQQELPGESPVPPPSTEPMALPQDVNAVIAQLEKAWESVKSMRASYRISLNNTVPPMNEGALLYISDGGTGKFKYELGFPDASNVTGGKEAQGTAIFDGVLLHLLLPSPDQSKIVEVRHPRLMAVPPPGGKVLFDLLKRDYVLTLEPTSDGNDDGTLVLKGQAMSDLPKEAGFPDVRVCFNPKNGGLISFEAISAPNGDLWKTEIFDPKFDENIDPMEFIFVSPENAMVIETWKNMPQRPGAGL